jgi:hypothetical protein
MIVNQLGPSMSALRTSVDKAVAGEEIALHEPAIFSLVVRRARGHGRARPGR